MGWVGGKNLTQMINVSLQLFLSLSGVRAQYLKKESPLNLLGTILKGEVCFCGVMYWLEKPASIMKTIVSFPFFLFKTATNLKPNNIQGKWY